MQTPEWSDADRAWMATVLNSEQFRRAMSIVRRKMEPSVETSLSSCAIPGVQLSEMSMLTTGRYEGAIIALRFLESMDTYGAQKPLPEIGAGFEYDPNTHPAFQQ